MDVYAGELEENSRAGDLREWYRHYEGGWTLSGRQVESKQYIQDENEIILWDNGLINEQEEEHFSTSLDGISATVDRPVIKQIVQRSMALSLGHPPSPNETEEALGAMSNGDGSGWSTCENPEARTEQGGIRDSAPLPQRCLYVWTSREVPQNDEVSLSRRCTHKKDRSECGYYRGISLVAYAAEVLLEIVVNRLRCFCEEQMPFLENSADVDAKDRPPIRCS